MCDELESSLESTQNFHYKVGKTEMQAERVPASGYSISE